MNFITDTMSRLLDQDWNDVLSKIIFKCDNRKFNPPSPLFQTESSLSSQVLDLFSTVLNDAQSATTSSAN